MDNGNVWENAMNDLPEAEDEATSATDLSPEEAAKIHDQVHTPAVWWFESKSHNNHDEMFKMLGKRVVIATGCLSKAFIETFVESWVEHGDIVLQEPPADEPRDPAYAMNYTELRMLLVNAIAIGMEFERALEQEVIVL